MFGLDQGQRPWIGEPGEERGRRLVDADVGGLCREDRGREQLERVAVVELALGIGILHGEPLVGAAGSTSRSAGPGHPATIANGTLTGVTLTVEGPGDGEFRWTIVVDGSRDHLDLGSALPATLADCPDGSVQLWIREVDQPADAAATATGFRRYRDLWQLRCPLPNAASGLTTRGFTLADLDDFIGVNNRAFHWHPEQGELTREAVLATMDEPWFDPEGFRVLHDPGSGDLIGFCWTKIQADHDPALGEIYVIAVDPSRQGRGYGKPMTLAGLEWLSDRGLRHGMLYVESDNVPANATYAALGFSRHHTDRAYRHDR